MTTDRPLRTWPALVFAVFMIAARLIAPLFGPDLAGLGLLGAALGAVLILLWWLFFSRAPWAERLGALALLAITIVVFRPIVDPSIRGGAMGFLFYVLGIPTCLLALAIAAWLTRARSTNARRAAIAMAVIAGGAVWMLARTAGVSGSGGFDIHWRWTPTPEQRLLAATRDEVVPTPTEPSVTAPAAQPEAAPATAAAEKDAVTAGNAPAPASAPRKAAEWPGFRGAKRDSVVHGPRIATDWTQVKPVEMWRRAVGPGWSSFAVDGDVFYTQEQRGEEEIVSAYRVSTGQPVWRHKDPVRFYESNAGPGPRGTPTLHDGRVYALGATGVLNVLDQDTGRRIWSRNAATDAERKTPIWGFSSSPIVTNGLVVVGVSGTVMAYDAASGAPRWKSVASLGSYSSPQLVTLDGVEQVVFMSGNGARGLSIPDGKILWDFEWEGAPIIQPAITPDGDLLLNTADMNGGLGIRRVSITRDGNSWAIQERWLSRGLKPYFNDYVVHNGHAYGFDGSILSCINLADGERKWKGGRYGNGQMILLADQDVLLVLSEDGDIALVNATADKYTELAKIPALNGKTWNHPVLVGNTLLVRNGEEMVAFRLGTSGT